MISFLRVSSVVLCAALAACGGGSKKSGKLRSVFVHGDPMASIAGTTPSATSIFKAEALTEFNDFNLYGGAILQERSPSGNAQTSEEGNEASTGGDASGLDRYTFTPDGGGFRYATAGTGKPAFLFADEGGALKATHVDLGDGVPLPIEPVHYSVNPAKTGFSLSPRTRTRTSTRSRSSRSRAPRPRSRSCAATAAVRELLARGTAR